MWRHYRYITIYNQTPFYWQILLQEVFNCVKSAALG